MRGRHLFPLVAAALALPLSAEQPKKPPFRDLDAALKLFAEEFVELTPGKGKFPAEFVMGSKDGRKEEQPAHTVKMSKPFAIARYEVTQELYQAVMGKNPAKWQGPRNSVEMVSWDEANEFCRKTIGLMRERKLLGDDETIRLPTEAEWEYACRAGTTTPFSFNKEADIGEYCWYKENSKGHDPPVGMKKANPWGLYDMHGYISEWCQDTWIDSYKDAPTDGGARQEKQVVSFVIRGGSYADPADGCRSAWRAGVDHKTRTDTLGFRCVRAKK